MYKRRPNTRNKGEDEEDFQWRMELGNTRKGKRGETERKGEPLWWYYNEEEGQNLVRP